MTCMARVRRCALPRLLYHVRASWTATRATISVDNSLRNRANRVHPFAVDGTSLARRACRGTSGLPAGSLLLPCHLE